MAEVTPTLKVDVNHNPTKKGIKVQFVLPQTLMGDDKAAMTQKLQTRLNQGLSKYNLTVNTDPDVPYANIIGFMIRIQDIRLLIQNALKEGGADTDVSPAAPPPAAAPSPAAPPPSVPGKEPPPKL